MVEEHLEAIAVEYGRFIDEGITMISASSSTPSPRKSPPKSLKRARVSEVVSPTPMESKMAKNVRLKRTMEEVSRTLGQMGAGDLESSISVVV